MPAISISRVDRMVWKPCSNGRYSVAEGIEHLRRKGNELWWTKHVWNKSIHPRPSGMAWKLFYGKFDFTDLQHAIRKIGKVKPFTRDLWHACIIGTIVEIWKGRNAIVFNDQSFKMNKVKNRIKRWIRIIGALSIITFSLHDQNNRILLDYYESSEDTDLREIFGECLPYYTGSLYFTGAILGGAKGAVEGIMAAELGDTTNIRVNRIWNAGRHFGRKYGNSLGVLGFLFGVMESSIIYYRDGNDGISSSVLAGLGAGAIYKAGSGPRSAALAGAIGGLAAAGAKQAVPVIQRYVTF
ncbi:Mitochondrial import inner membrane translocase subunit tim23-3 [Thalictrum thalictroides]|uniref:Mitochondrial import inner membrane translocase subunit tim23-3 n=1 Tax=Thalictrum thalictroides TaxID=46969 RepID=A0A7J6WY42_THATH|nr:Mitochondrial import inner membrane translocase subunit tim23-3 [Thalictrum thalictroides]